LSLTCSPIPYGLVFPRGCLFIGIVNDKGRYRRHPTSCLRTDIWPSLLLCLPWQLETRNLEVRPISFDTLPRRGQETAHLFRIGRVLLEVLHGRSASVYKRTHDVDTGGMLELPIVAKAGVIFLIFLAEVVVLHIFLIAIPPLRLKKTGWAVIQYVVIALALLGLMTAISNARQLVAQGLLGISRPHLQFEFRDLRGRVDDYSSPGIVCRTFVRGEFSPPPEEFNRAQREFDDVCQWFKKISTAIPKELPAGDADIDWQSLSAPPQVSDAQLIDTIHRFRQTLDGYNTAAKSHRDLQAAAQRSGADSFFIFLLPLSLSLALALQATKVTADAWYKPS